MTTRSPEPTIEADDQTQSFDFAIQPSAARQATPVRREILSDPGYGVHFTDHLALATWTHDAGWRDDRVEGFGALSLSPAAAVLHYGQAVFKGLKVYRHPDGTAWSFRPMANARRFQRSARRIALPELPTAAFMQAIQSLVSVDTDWIPDRPDSSLYLRPFMFADEAYLGNRPARTVTFCLIASPAGSYFPNGVAPIDVWVSTDYIRATPGGTGEAKFGGNYAAALAAQIDAATHLCDQVLFVDAAQRRWIEELGGMNIFAVYDDGTVATPQLSGSILHGITRDSILTLAEDLGHPTAEVKIALESLLDDARSGRLTELFACGTAAVITPIGRLVTDNHSVPIGEKAEMGPTTRAVRKQLLEIQYGIAPDTHGWLHRWS